MAIDERNFLKTIAKSLGRTEPLAKAPKRNEAGPPSFWQEQKFEANDPFDFFKKNLEALTGRVELAASADEANRIIEDWLRELKAQSVIMWDHPELKKYIKLEMSGIKLDYWSPSRDENQLVAAAEQADVGITWADYAIGYSGTVALLCGPGKGRSVSLLPHTHIAVFLKSNLVPTMSSIMHDLTRFGTEKLPSVIDFITGPSRTSDIEMDLSIGVHGPFRVWTVIIDDQ